MPSLSRKLAALAALALGVTAGLVAARTSMDPATTAESAPGAERLPLLTALSRMQLDDAQLAAIQRLVAAEQERVASLERTLEATEEMLRSEEMTKPFDVLRVNALVVRHAEILAYMRGTESRVVSEISDLLTDEQQRVFARLRISARTEGDAPEARPRSPHFQWPVPEPGRAPLRPRAPDDPRMPAGSVAALVAGQLEACWRTIDFHPRSRREPVPEDR